MIAEETKVSGRAVLRAVWAAGVIVGGYYLSAARDWIAARLFPLLLGFVLGIIAGVYGTRDQVRDCRGAADPTSAQMACAEWLR